MYARSGGLCNDHFMADLLLTLQCVGERIVKSGQYLMKLWKKTYWLIFWTTLYIHTHTDEHLMTILYVPALFYYTWYYKIAMLVHRSLSGRVPSYLADDCWLVTNAGVRRLRSANTRQSHTKLFWRHNICCGSTSALEQFAVWYKTTWHVLWSV